MFSRLGAWLYNLCFPLSERSHGYSHSRQNRLEWLWRRLSRWLRKSQAGAAFRSLSERWRNLVTNRLNHWWQPPSKSADSYPAYGRRSRSRLELAWKNLQQRWQSFWPVRKYRKLKDSLTNRFHDWWYPSSKSSSSYPTYGHRRRSRLDLAWKSAQRRIESSWLGRKYHKLKDPLASRFYDWWYPPSKTSSSYPTYGHRRRSRLELAWKNAQRKFESSWLGRKYLKLAGDFYDWYFPVVEDSGHGYGYGSHRRVSRPVRWIRRNIRRFRKSWLGKKTGWLLDELDDLILQVQIQAEEDFAWKRIRKRFNHWQTWVVLIGLIAATGFGIKYGVPRYQRFTEQRYAQQAQRFAANGDFARALLRARQVLSLNQDNAAATGVFADVADHFGSPYAIQWRQRLVFLNADPTNRIALARSAMRMEAFPYPMATKALNAVAPASRQSSAYHLAAGALAVKLNNLPEAEQHYAEALKLNPNDPVNRMSLAVVRLQSGNPKLITDSRTTLELLATDGQIGLLAQRTLVAESIARHEFARAETLSQEILTNQQVSFGDRMVHLTILKVDKSPRFETYLEELKKYSETNPVYLGEMGSWMNRFGYPQATLDWLKGLPPQFTKKGLIPIVIADAYVALGQWKELASYLEKERWTELDAVRLGMMSLASWKEFGDKRQSTTWQQAIVLAARSPTTLNTLAQLAAEWGWKEETEDVLWFTVEKYPSESWPLTALERLYTGQRDTAGLWRVFRAKVQKDPTDTQAQNNFAMVSMLLGVELADAQQTAAKLHAADPNDPVLASTYAFSLYLQGRPKEAAQTLRALGLDQLDNPSLAAYYGVFLAATGDKQTAQSYLNKSAKALLLPQELELVDRARQAK